MVAAPKLNLGHRAGGRSLLPRGRPWGRPGDAPGDTPGSTPARTPRGPPGNPWGCPRGTPGGTPKSVSVRRQGIRSPNYSEPTPPFPKLPAPPPPLPCSHLAMRRAAPERIAGSNELDQTSTPKHSPEQTRTSKIKLGRRFKVSDELDHNPSLSPSPGQARHLGNTFSRRTAIGLLHYALKACTRQCGVGVGLGVKVWEGGWAPLLGPRFAFASSSLGLRFVFAVASPSRRCVCVAFVAFESPSRRPRFAFDRPSLRLRLRFAFAAPSWRLRFVIASPSLRRRLPFASPSPFRSRLRPA